MTNLKLIFRQLWSNRLFTILNLIGMAIGIAASWIIFRISSYEYSFNSAFNEKEKIFKVVSNFDFDGNSGNNEGIPQPLAISLNDSMVGISDVVPVFATFYENIFIPSKNLKFKDDNNVKTLRTNKSYFEVFNYEWLAGNPQNSLSAKSNIVITDELAQKYFDTKDYNKCLGQSIIFNDTIIHLVSGIIKKPTVPNDLNYSSFIPFTAQNIPDDFWGQTNSDDQLFIKLKDEKYANKTVKAINDLSIKKSEVYMKNWGTNMKRWHSIVPLPEVHFMTEFGGTTRKANKSSLFYMFGVALFLLTLASINYVNMSIANIPNRSKEIGIRKTVGGSNRSIVTRFMAETLVILLFATLSAFGIAQIFFQNYSFTIPEGMANYINLPLFIGFLAAVILILTLVTSIYPGYVMSKYKITNIIKNSYNINTKSSPLGFKQVLIIFQFVVAGVFVIGTLIVDKQFKYLASKDLGFKKEGVIHMNLPWEYLSDSTLNNKKFALKNEIAKIAGVNAVSLSEPLLRQGMSSNSFTRIDEKGKKVEVLIQRKISDTDVSNVYGLKLLAGRLLNEGEHEDHFVLNRSSVIELGFKAPQEALGVQLKEAYSGKEITIVGVVEDFHTLSLSTKISPVAIMNYKDQLQGFSIKLDPKNTKEWPKTFEKIKNAWTSFYPDLDFKYAFFDETISRMLEFESILSQLIKLASIITILLSCLGLFGLSTLQANQKTKEIGIRKVLGASIASIILMLSRNFLIIVVIAFVIAAPIAYYFTNNWLQNYAFQAKISYWLYAIALFILVIISVATILYQALKAAIRNPVESLKTE
jgi:putative ABC transport system permease protein